MRTLKLQMQVSVDGFASTGPNDEQRWVTWALEEITPYVLDLFDSTDTILIGRKLAVDYIPYWQSVLTQPDDPMYAFAERIVAAKKIVFSKTLQAPDPSWQNTVVATGDLAEEVQRLKTQPGKDMIVYGGVSFVSSLIKAGLIDDLHLFINPVAIGRGESPFSEVDGFLQLAVQRSVALPCGIVLMHYRPKAQ